MCDIVSARPGVRNLGGLEMRVDAIVLETLQCPLAGAIHLWRASQASSDFGREIFEVLHQLGVGLHFVGDFLVCLLHGSTVRALLVLSAR